MVLVWVEVHVRDTTQWSWSGLKYMYAIPHNGLGTWSELKYMYAIPHNGLGTWSELKYRYAIPHNGLGTWSELKYMYAIPRITRPRAMTHATGSTCTNRLEHTHNRSNNSSSNIFFCLDRPRYPTLTIKCEKEAQHGSSVKS